MTRLDWPAGALAAKDSGEVANTVLATADAIGDIDYDDVVDQGYVGVAMNNADGQSVAASVDGFDQVVMHSTW